MTTGPESGADTAGAAGAAGAEGRGLAGTEAGGLVDALWQAARVAERRTAYQLDRLDRLAGGAATLRDAPGDPQPGPAGPPPDPYWITAEALRQRHLRERRLLVAAAALVAELWQWEARGQPPPEGPGPDLPAAPGGARGGCPRCSRPLAGLCVRRPCAPPQEPAPARPLRSGAGRTPPWSTGCAGKAGAGRRRWPSALSSPPPGAQDGASTAGARRWSCASTFRRARARARVPGPSAPLRGLRVSGRAAAGDGPRRRRAGGAAACAARAAPPLPSRTRKPDTASNLPGRVARALPEAVDPEHPGASTPARAPRRTGAQQPQVVTCAHHVQWPLHPRGTLGGARRCPSLSRTMAQEIAPPLRPAAGRPAGMGALLAPQSGLRVLAPARDWALAHAELVTCTAVLLVSLFHLGRVYNRGFNLLDEGFVLHVAERVMQGQVPYRDFFTQLTPGAFLALAAVFAVTGPSVLAGRWVTVVIGLLITALLYLGGRRVLSRPTAALTALAFPVWGIGQGWFYPNYSWFALAGCMVALECTLRAVAPSPSRGAGSGRPGRPGRPSPRAHSSARPALLWAAGAGLACGVAAFCKQNMGLYALLGLAGAVFLFGAATWRRRLPAGLADGPGVAPGAAGPGGLAGTARGPGWVPAGRGVDSPGRLPPRDGGPLPVHLAPLARSPGRPRPGGLDLPPGLPPAPPALRSRGAAPPPPAPPLSCARCTRCTADARGPAPRRPGWPSPSLSGPPPSPGRTSTTSRWPSARPSSSARW